MIKSERWSKFIKLKLKLNLNIMYCKCKNKYFLKLAEDKSEDKIYFCEDCKGHTIETNQKLK